MNAFTFSIQGNLKPTALRHHVFVMAYKLGIRGFLNYRNGMLELFIHAEGEEEIMLEFIYQVDQLVKKHNLICFKEAVALEDFPDFKILPLKNQAENNSLHSYCDNSSTDHTQNNTAEALCPDLNPGQIEVKRYIPRIRKVILPLKHIGL